MICKFCIKLNDVITPRSFLFFFFLLLVCLMLASYPLLELRMFVCVEKWLPL